MTAHLPQSDIDRLALNNLSTTEWGRVRRHLCECDTCLHRLLDTEGPLPMMDSADRSAAGAPAQAPPPIRAYVY